MEAFESVSRMHLYFLSKFPVGSSAKIILGSISKQRAIAVRCCSPPEISFIYFSSIFLIPNQLTSCS